MSQLKKSMQAARPAGEIAAEKPSLEIGQKVEGKGIFAGLWQPWGDGRILAKKFSVYAAPEDLADSSGQKLLTFRQAATEVVKLQNWHGRDGLDVGGDDALYRLLNSGRYHGNWIIPPRVLLIGTNNRGELMWNHGLYQSKDTGAFAGTFAAHGQTPQHAPFYWSCSLHTDDQKYVTVCFANGLATFDDPNTARNYCRPVWLEPAP